MKIKQGLLELIAISVLVFCVIMLVVSVCTEQNDLVESVPVGIESHCVNIKAGGLQGSGTVFTKVINGTKEYFVLTAAHVLANVHNDEVWEEVTVVREVRDDNGVMVGVTKYPARVMICDFKCDISILYVGQVDNTTSARIDMDMLVPLVGTELFHCGSPSGQDLGYNSLTDGILSQTGKKFFGEIGYYSQITCASLPGSSGGGVFFASDGSYFGMITSGIRGTENFSYAIPSKLILDWASERGVGWLFSDNLEYEGKINPENFMPQGEQQTWLTILHRLLSLLTKS